MPRPAQFDRTEMLDRAVRQFWRHGFHALSLDDLLDRIGLSRASMYRTYGTKAEFYAEALDRYRKVEGVVFVDCLDDGAAAIDTIANVFDVIVDQSLDETRPPGCFVVAAVGERVPDDPTTTSQIVEQFDLLDRLFADVLRRGVERGELRDDVDVEQWGRFVVSAIQGLRTLAIVRTERAPLQTIADANIAALRTLQV